MIVIRDGGVIPEFFQRENIWNMVGRDLHNNSPKGELLVRQVVLTRLLRLGLAMTRFNSSLRANAMTRERRCRMVCFRLRRNGIVFVSGGPRKTRRMRTQPLFRRVSTMVRIFLIRRLLLY